MKELVLSLDDENMKDLSAFDPLFEIFSYLQLCFSSARKNRRTLSHYRTLANNQDKDNNTYVRQAFVRMYDHTDVRVRTYV